MVPGQIYLFREPHQDGPVSVSSLRDHLNQNHYLGAARRGIGWSDGFGCMVLASPTSRHLPHKTWLELTRWCLNGQKNGGSKQWRSVRSWLLKERPKVTTVVSYSDPSAGHSGSLYRACNWLWAPTWHRIKPPPTGNGSWTKGKAQAVKDRWIFPLRPDPQRERILKVGASYFRRFPWSEYRDPIRWKKGRGIGGGADYREFTKSR